jgi:hypothetical protein
MAKEGKLICNCGGYFEDKQHNFDSFATEAAVCNKCGHVTLSREQAEEYIKLKRMHQCVDSERKVIRIGNSFGLTLPEQLKEFGTKVGDKVKITALSSNSFKIELCAK